MPELEPLKRSGSNDFSQPKRFLVEPLLAFVQLPERCAETVQFSANQFERFLSGSLLASILLVVIGVERRGAENGERGLCQDQMLLRSKNKLTSNFSTAKRSRGFGSCSI